MSTRLLWTVMEGARYPWALACAVVRIHRSCAFVCHAVVGVGWPLWRRFLLVLSVGSMCALLCNVAVIGMKKELGRKTGERPVHRAGVHVFTPQKRRKPQRTPLVKGRCQQRIRPSLGNKRSVICQFVQGQLKNKASHPVPFTFLGDFFFKPGCTAVV